ncbi:MAG: hypothetical protein ABI707_12320 [Ferruginibacter sp.]
MKLNRTLTALFLYGFPLFFFSNNIFAQDTASESPFYQAALVNAKTVYHQSFGNQSALYNGSKYAEYLFRFTEGHPFFYSAQPARGAVIYDGIRFDSVLMQYDETKDLLVVYDYSDKIQLWSEKVEYFNLFNSDFIRVVKDSFNNSLAGTGFYNLLYKGKICLLKKQIKTVREIITSNELQHFADEKDHYYIKNDDGIHLVKKRKDLFKLLGDRRKEVQQFIRANKLSFRKDRQNMLTQSTTYYDRLKK